MNINPARTSDPSSLVHGIKRSRKKEPTPSGTNKKIKTATKDLFSTLPTEIIEKILSHLDGISLVRVSETAWKYTSLINSCEYLATKILLDKILASMSVNLHHVKDNVLHHVEVFCHQRKRD